jgi:hypothetical protein
MEHLCNLKIDQVIQKPVPHISGHTYHRIAQDSQAELSADLCISLSQAVSQEQGICVI